MSKLFWNAIASRYAKSSIADEEIYQRKLEITREFFKPNMRVLEFGCGTGSTALLHAPYVKEYIAMDSSTKMIEIANEKLQHSDLGNLTFTSESFEDYTGTAESFDMILGLNILHLMRAPDKVLEKIHSLLKPGGYFVQSTPCILDSTPWLRFVFPPISWTGLLPHLVYLSAEDLLQLMEVQGFNTVYQLDKKTPAQAEFMVSEKQSR